ncbi:MAG: 2-C-methyl-D-erythritol 4-phosphate cytidylyltransferase [Xanthomonadales bacterium]|nr:2-C-methyl-D-erythritol 4-phosphate cytidylyltransferase [Xanthomonadales bacterium]NIX13311.1 2-C-methyl-D-erythritol 4-phosphate cytidylyltransferase [Xanthomonadales bacterium]
MTCPVVHALIPAAGRGQRFGGEPKQYQPLAGKPVLAHAIEAVGVSSAVRGVTVAIAADDREFEKQVRPGCLGVLTVEGGATRAHSVMNGLRSIARSNPDTQWVLVHDAARPCLAREELERLLELGLACADGAILALPIGDTMKRSGENGRIEATVERERLWAAQTPQLFPLGRLTDALREMLERGETPTDEAAVMEWVGARPLLVRGSPANIKITWPGDLAIAEAWLAGRETGA